MHSLAERKASARWCKTVCKPGVVHLSAAELRQPPITYSPVSTFSARGSHVSLVNNSRESRQTTNESSRRVRFLSESGCSCTGATHCKDDCMAALPLFNDAIDWPQSHLLHLATKQVLWQIAEDFPTAEQQQAEHKKLICEFVQKYNTAGIPARQQHRWRRLRACTLTMTASLKVTVSTAERESRSSNMSLSHVVDVRREGRTVTLRSSKRILWRGCCTTFLLDTELEAIHLVCVLKAMMRITISGSCDSSTSSLTRHGSSSDASSSSVKGTSRRRWYRP
jgi:hypothetical protein